MKDNIWVTTEIYNHAEQKLLIQPTPSFDGIEIYIQEVGGEPHSSGAFYINKEELPVIISKLQEMMDYINKK
jgi:hypothetical protein